FFVHFFFSSRRRHTSSKRDWSSDVCSSDLSFLNYANQYTKPFNEISGVVTELQNALACAGRVFALMEEPERRPDPDKPRQPEKRSEERRVGKECRYRWEMSE